MSLSPTRTPPPLVDGMRRLKGAIEETRIGIDVPDLDARIDSCQGATDLALSRRLFEGTVAALTAGRFIMGPKARGRPLQRTTSDNMGRERT